MVVKPLSPRPFDKFSESLNLRYKNSKSRKKAQKEQLNPTFSGDLTAVSPVWTIYQTKPTTNDYSYYTLLDKIFQVFLPFFKQSFPIKWFNLSKELIIKFSLKN